MPEKEPKYVLDRGTIDLVLKIVKKSPKIRHGMPHSGKTADNGMHCTCKGMQPDPECPCHRLIG